MSREQERRRDEIADQLSQALGAAAELMTQRIEAASTVRRLNPAAHPARGRRPGRPRRWMHDGWLVPLAAAVAVAALIAGSVLASRARFGATPPSSPPGLPAFYLTVNGAPGQQVEVHKTSDGAVTGTLRATHGWYIGDVSATADDRVFFAAETPIANPGHPDLCPANRFLRFGITAAGAVTGLRQVGAQANGMDLSLAASPDGTRLAYYTYCGGSLAWTLHVITLTSGAISSWTSAWISSVNTTSPADVSGPEGLAWTADGRSLALGYQWKGASAAYDQYQAVLLLNIGSGSGPVQDHSHVLWHQDPSCTTSCVYSAVISPDGTSLIASVTKTIRPGNEYDMSIDRLSPQTGQVTGVLYRTTALTRVMGVPSLTLSGDSSGTYWLVQEGGSLGWSSDGQFHWLQPYGTIQEVAW
jgi:hypothetical protein